MNELIATPEDLSMDDLCQELVRLASRGNSVTDWPEDSLRLCADSGVFRWFLPEGKGGFGWSDRDQTLGYLRLAESDLVTTFVITQYMGAIRRIAASEHSSVADNWLERLVEGKVYATVGISHLTTSRRHLAEPVLRAKETTDGFILSGMSPWVTGGAHAELLVIGATLDCGRQILVAVPSELEGVSRGVGVDLVALSASCTDRVEFREVHVRRSMLLGGPCENVLQSGVGARTGGLQTSTLAVGLSMAALGFLEREAANREDLSEPTQQLRAEVNELKKTLLLACDDSQVCEPSEIRARANRLVLRSTQAALMAAKGAGYVEGHPVGRWCRQALFFLVWSCPQPVSHAHLCELAFGSTEVS
ncbi:acyl-CoA/acyl-ACP dehydrogenase [Rubripirellula sp.]|nr:acyl-CoA dehydrogenase family protein [Rubripirellula sp.]MDB4339096.1 acyl-CoA/acyl-ACP dehydrogenase [Rubripirellula sp.]